LQILSAELFINDNAYDNDRAKLTPLPGKVFLIETENHEQYLSPMAYDANNTNGRHDICIFFII